MQTFIYTGRRNGKRVSGTLIGHDATSVAGQLKNSGVVPISITEDKRKSSKKFNFQFNFNTRVSTDDLLMFCRQMYTLVHAGVPLVRAIRGLAEMVVNPQFSKVLFDVANTVETGKPLAIALGKHPAIFTSLFSNMIYIGENTGKLDAAFHQVSEYLVLENETKNRVQAATRYPKIVLITIFIAIVVVNLFVVPTFAKIFRDFKAELPFTTKLLIMSSDFFVHYWIFLLGGMVGFFLLMRSYVKTKDGRYFWDRWKLKIPLMGNLILQTLLARFTRGFASMLQAGVPIVQALRVVSQAVGNVYMAAHIEQIRQRTEAGASITQSASAAGLFTPLVLQMMSVGEETGTLETMLIQVADFYEREVDYSLKKLSDSIEPLLILMIGIMVLLLALGVFLPLWTLSTTLR